MPRKTQTPPEAEPNAGDAGVVVALPSKKKAERTPEETVQRIIELRQDRKGLPTIANTLNAEGIKTATGKEWRPQTIRQILLRHDAMGEPVINRQPKQEEPVAVAAVTDTPKRRRAKKEEEPKPEQGE